MKTEKVSAKHTALSVLFAVLLFFFILSFSISLPIYLRPFYYWQIEPLGLPERSGFSKAQIIEAYDDVLDYLTLPDTEFKSGEMRFSEDGADHFRDCKILFNINTLALVTSPLGLTALLVLKRVKRLKPYSFFGIPAYAFSGAAAIIAPTVVGVLASLDFDRAFMVFHKIFFPNKLNWIMDPVTNEFVTVVPHSFFMRCAILIGASVVVFSGALITVGLIKFFKNRVGGVDIKT